MKIFSATIITESGNIKTKVNADSSLQARQILHERTGYAKSKIKNVRHLETASVIFNRKVKMLRQEVLANIHYKEKAEIIYPIDSDLLTHDNDMNSFVSYQNGEVTLSNVVSSEFTYNLEDMSIHDMLTVLEAIENHNINLFVTKQALLPCKK